MRRLDDCSDQEMMLLTAIIALAKQLPYELAYYTLAFGQISRTYFPKQASRGRGDHNPSTGSLAITHEVRRRPKWT